MNCTINKVKLSFDVEDRLYKTIMRVSKTDANKATVLAGFLTNSDFKKFLLENITVDDVLQGETISFNLFSNGDYLKINQNRLGSLLADFYKNTYLSVDNSSTIKGMGKLDGFTSARAKQVAKEYVSSMIIDEYREELRKNPKNRRKPLRIIADVNDKINATFYQRMDSFVQYLLSKENASERAKDMANQYIEFNTQLQSINKVIEDYNDWVRSTIIRQQEIGNQIKEYNRIAREAKSKNDIETYKKAIANKKEVKKVFDEITEDTKRLKNIKDKNVENGAAIVRDRYALAQNIVTLFADNYDNQQGVKLRNYANLVIQSRANADDWYFQVFNSQTMTFVVKEFNKIGSIEEYLDEQDDNNDNVNNQYHINNIDETAKSWEDNLYRNFEQTINGKLRMILSTIPKMANKFNPTSAVQALDTENELGVSTYMDARYLTVQIYSFGDFSNVKSFVDSLDRKSQTIKSLYGLGRLVNAMKNNKDFANFVYCNFAKPVADKTMLVISDITNEDGMKFDYSNATSFPLAELVFRMSNKIRATYNSTYDATDIATLDKIYKDFITNNDKDTLNTELFAIVNKYFPNFGRETFTNCFDNIPAEELNNSVNILIRNLKQIIDGAANLKRTINNKELELNKKFEDALTEYHKKLKEYKSLDAKQRKGKKEPEYPTREYVDYANYDLTKTMYAGIIRFANQIIKYTDSRAQLNSANANGDSSSNVLKNCYVTRLFEQIKAGTEEDANAGLKALRDFIKQGTEDGSDNQYSNNPLFFGLKDENGILIKDSTGNPVAEGLFTRTATGIEINKNAKDIIKYNLFDGTKNTQDFKSDVYESMSKLDFFITQYVAFRDSVADISEDGKIKNIGNLNSAVYSMRIGSDKPTIFFIRAPRYNKNQVQYAIYGHVMDELNMFIKGINNIFIQDGETLVNGEPVPVFRTRTDVNNLIGRAFFGEKTADRLKQKGEQDMTPAIVKDGKLRGNLFQFVRLFTVNGYNAGERIESMLSLYGGRNEGGLISTDKNGRLRLNPNQTISYNAEKGKFELNLSQEQKQQLKQIVREWTENFLIDVISRTAGNVKVLQDNNIPFDQRTLEDFLLNSVNMNMNYDDLFEGDYKYYNGARDFLKRSKESQAGGEVYAGYDITEEFNPTIKELTWYGSPESIQIESKDLNDNGNPIKRQVIINGRPLIAKNGFRGVTIYNTVKASDYTADMQKELEEIFIRQGMNEAVAHERSVKIASGYGFAGGERTKINDAQSYITFEEFIRRKWADGTISDYADLIRQLTDNTPVGDLNLDEINARIQVQKNFYYDIVFDKDTGLFYPRQIKNAEFVLIPKLLPEGSQLRKVHDWMQEHNIGQLNTAETSKAAKKNVFTIWDAETGAFNEKFADNFDESYVESYYYKYLYKQQDVPQHMINEHNKFGVQIAKKIIDNIINEEELNLPDNEDGTEDPRKTKRKNLIKVVEDYQNAYAANIKEDFIRFLDNMGWVYDFKTGNIVNSEYATTDMYGNKLPDEVIETNRTTLNFNNFYTRAREEAARLGMDSNFIEYLIPNEFGDPTMPNCMNNFSTKLESIAQAIYNNKITRQTLPGWHAAQITGVGYSRHLKFDAKTGVMEVYLPRWSNLIPKTKNAQEEAELIKQIQEEGLDIHLGYRIPTEGKQSIAILKVVGFTNDALGSTIVVPDEWVTQTGSDFDVDSVYGICWELYATKDKKTNKVSLHRIPFEENVVDERNLYIKYVNDRLSDKVGRTEIGQEIESKTKELKDELAFVNERGEISEQFKEFDAKRNELFTKLPGWARGIIKDINTNAKRFAKKNKETIDIKESYEEIRSKLTTYLDKYKLSEEESEVVREYNDYLTSLLDLMSRQAGIPKFDVEQYQSKKADAIQELVQKAIDKQVERCEKKAKAVGLLSFEEWSKLPFVEKLDKRARNNYIFDKMLKIMADDTSREEQYGRSNFEKITNSAETGANDVIDKISGKKDRIYSPYNPLDQLDYFEDAMGGARLKALSVNWDTFISKNNKVRAFVADEDTVQVVLTVDDVSAEDSQVTYNEEEIRKSYGEDVTEYNENNESYKTDYNLKNQSVGNITMRFSYGSNKRKNVTARNTFDAIKKGERTATTRYAKNGNIEYLSRFKKGDIVEVTNGSGKKLYIRITKPLHKLNTNHSVEEWSKKEGWSTDYYNREVKAEVEAGTAYQMEYEYVPSTGEDTKANKPFPVKGVGSANGSEINDKDAEYIKKNIGIGAAKTTIETLSSDNNELTEEEKIVVKKELGNKPRVVVASEATDPIFHSKKVKQLVEQELAKPLKDRKFHMMYIITKHDGIPFREMAELKIPKFVHFSITSLGGTKYEPGVMKMDDLLDRIETFINEGVIKPQLTTIRIDPIIPGVTKKEDIRHIVERATKMGIKNFKFSIMDSYGSSENTKTSRFIIKSMRDLGYDWDKYYDLRKDGTYAFNPKQVYINDIYTYMDNLAGEYGIHFNTCGENFNLPLKNIRTNVGCINVDAMNKAMGTTDIVHVAGNQRSDCSCFGNKCDVLTYNDACASSCAYCYAKHNSNVAMTYYNEDGTLKDNAFTRTAKQLQEESEIVKETKEEQKPQRKILFTARRLGWSNNNRNLVGGLVTTDTSQTTAHHLDAVKMGSVPNVNEYTFNVYKYLSGLGIDYETVIGFIRQPVITNLVYNNNLINSIFVSSQNNAIRMTLVDIAKRLKLKNNNTDIDYSISNYDLINVIKSNGNIISAFRNLFGIDISDMSGKQFLNLKLPLDKQRMFTRIKRDAQNKGNIYENAAFDLSILLAFRNIQISANRINKQISATASDKFGAMPSIHETRRMIDQINELRDDYTLYQDDKSFMDLIYPLVEGTTDMIDVEKSEYKPLAAMYAYATITSLQTNTQLFVTENDNFATTENIIQRIIHHRFTDSEYKEYKRFAIAYLYTEIEKLLTPLLVDKKGRIIFNTAEVEQSGNELKTANDYWNAERSRICGYGVTLDGDFEVKNVNKPTKKEIERFAKLTPAQKVIFMQRHFPDNQGIFNSIKVTLLNNTDVKYKGISRQYLAFDDQVDNIETLLYLFTESFSNRNPLIKLTAIDLIKYAFIAEGFNFKTGYISKTVPNSTLYKSIEEGGLDIVDEIKSRVQQLAYTMRSEDFIDMYVRSHHEIVPIYRLDPLPPTTFDPEIMDEVFTKQNASTIFLSSTRSDKLIHLDATTTNNITNNLIKRLQLFSKAGGYIKVAFPIDKNHSKTVLYKVEGRNPEFDARGNEIAYKDYFLVPLNLLDKYETYEHSYNKNYNIFNSKDYYDSVIENLSQRIASARDELFKTHQNIEHNINNNEDLTEEERERLNRENEEQRKKENNKLRENVNKNVPSVIMPVGAFPIMEINLAENNDWLTRLYTEADEYTKGGVKKLLDGIIAHVKDTQDDFSTPYVQFNNNISISRMIPPGTAVTQNVIMADGTVMNVTIAHHKIDQQLYRNLRDFLEGKKEAGEYSEAIADLNKTNTLIENSNFYRITKTKQNPAKLRDTALKAATDLIVDEDETSVAGPQQKPRRERIDVVSSAIINEISYEARKNGTPISHSFVHELERHHVNRNMGSSIIENRGNIYRSAARYYRSVANTIINKLNSFKMIDDKGNVVEFSMDSEKMYEYLAQHDEYFREVADVILRGITFGNRIADIFNLDISTEDAETKQAVEEIINSINSVRQNKKLADAMNNIINIYFKKYSTNPEVVRGVIQLRETFGDLDKIDELISDPTDIDNSEVQVILKEVYAMFAKAEMFDARKNVEEWKKLRKEIEHMAGTIDINHVIDSERGMLRQAHNTQFLEDKQRLIDAVNDAYANRKNSLADFEKYLRAQYDRDLFMHQNTEQYIIPMYYEEDLNLRKNVMRNAGYFYFKYRQLADELHDTNTGIDDSNESNDDRKRRIISEMNQLRSTVDENGILKSEREREQIDALNKYISERQAMLERYFTSQEYEGFQADYERYKHYIDSYNATHKYDSLEKKLADDVQFREAYDWIKNNGKVAFGSEQSLELRQAFEALTGRKNFIRNTTMARLRSIERVIDESGEINPMKLTDEQIAQIRDEEMPDLARQYDSSYTESILIKDVPKDVPMMYSRPKNEDEVKDIYDELKYKDNGIKNAIITEINKIVGKCVDKYTGTIDVATMFNNAVVSDEERVKLATLYARLRNLRIREEKCYKKHKNKVYEDRTNTQAYDDAMNYYRTNLQNTKQGRQFLNIFTEVDETGNLVANSYIYGYKVPTEEYTDHKKTKARDYINNNVDFVTTEYYDIAKRQAEEQGTEAYNKWFALNHVYNLYTHKWDPLKIWTRLEAKPGSALAESITYVPSFNNLERSVKKEYINNEENRKRLGLDGKGYQEFSNNYKKGNAKYDSNITLNTKEEALRDLYIKILNKYATTYQGKRFVGQGYLPRERKAQIDARWAAGQLGALLGLSWHSGADSDAFYKEVDYSHDKEAEFNMLTLLHDKGTQKYKPLPIKGTMSNEEYAKEVAKVREENRKIQAANEKIDNAILNKNWDEVMEDFVHNATIFNARQSAKPYLYLLLEDLSINNAYMLKGVWGKHLVKDRATSTDDDTRYMKIPQSRTRELVHNLARRLLYEQHHENNTYRAVANFLQNLTSAKYMVFNLYGGIANVTTGHVNIDMENRANEYFGYSEFLAAEKQYLANVGGTIATMYSDKAKTLTGALIKKFNVVNFDDILQFGAGSKDLSEQLKRVRNWLYSFQSMGEHYMQNSVLLAMLKSNRLYTDINGVQRIGDFFDYTWDIERKAMEETLKNNKTLLANYQAYCETLKDNTELKYEIVTNKKDLNRSFLHSLRDNLDSNTQKLYKSTSEAYHKKRKELMDKAKENFRKNPTIESLFEFKNGEAVLTEEAIRNFNAKGKNPIGDLETLIAKFQEKVIQVNKKIHGVYDKKGAAQIESKWWGSLLMQYHKHLYNGIFKRWRRKGFYSEFRGSRERGSYITLMSFLGTEFTNMKERIGNKQENGTNIMLASIQVAMESAINTMTNIQLNWNNLSNWEKANIRRNLGDITGVLVAAMIIVALYGLFDDDELKDDNFKASLLYLADRLYSDSSMYSPIGLVTEYKTAWSSPIASANGPSDLIKAMMMLPKALFDPEFNPKYQSGQYAGKNKFEVLLRRNIPGVRPWDRIQLITRNNKYYKVGESQIGVNIAKSFGETLHGDD